MSALIPLVVLATVTTLIHLYLWQRLVRDTVPRGRWRRGAGWALVAAALLMVGAMLIEPLPLLPQPYETWLAWPGFLWLGLMFYLLVVLLALELPVLAARLGMRLARRRRQLAEIGQVPAGDRKPAEPEAVLAGERKPAATDAADPAGSGAMTPPGVDRSRRRLLRQAAAITAGVAAVGIGGYGVTRAYREPTVIRRQLPLARLDSRADGLRVAVIADLHVGPLYGSSQVERVVELVNGLNADLVAVVGDMVSGEVGQVRDSAAPLRRMRSRYGSFFVTGNHEYYTGHEEWIEAADDLGLRVLRNERVEITHGGAALDLAGVNDREGAGYGDPPDYAAALADRDPSRPVVLLAHQPVQVHEAARYGVDLQLSGHTHGGQVFPFHYLVRLDQPVVSGLSEVDGTKVYVTNGAGFWGPPMRVGADPDVTLLELRAA